LPRRGASLADDLHGGLIDDLTRRSGVVMLVGGPDTGKSSFARRLLAAALGAGKTAAYVDADVDQTTTGPPTCVGLHWVHGTADLDDLGRADALKFVGSTTPEGLVLQQVIGTAALVDRARPLVDLVVVDTTGVVSGVVGQTLKYHKMELCRPDVVVGLQRGAELDPIVGMLRRFFSADVEVAAVDPGVRPASPEDRRSRRAAAFADAFAEPLQRWRVRPTVFAPTLPAGLDLHRLDGMLVGLQDGDGWCLGLGVLENSGDVLRVITNMGEDMRGLRLGSMHIELETFETRRVRLREVMFGVD
jgi:polynucleotide 5'-hydroxyl-kinase GRC3/NOL9